MSIAVALTPAAFGSYSITEAELEERLSALHGQTVGSAMAATVFHSQEIPANVLEQRLIDQFGARWDTLSPDRRERLITDHRELLTNVAHAEAERLPRGEFDPDAHEPRPPREVPDFSGTLRQPLIDAEGNPTDRRAMREARQERSLARIPELREQRRIMRQRAEEWSLATGEPLRWEDPEHLRATELIGIDDDGRHLYYGTFNFEGAETISTTEVWPGGGTGLDLTGSGRTIGMWDGGAMRTTHIDLYPRAEQRDMPPFSDPHATAVAGSIMASGNNHLSARGTSFEGDLWAYWWGNDFEDMREAATDHDLVLSNHSYGLRAGWIFEPSVGMWFWYGETAVSPTVDWKFGFYHPLAREADSIAYYHWKYLTVWAAGNDQLRGPANQPVTHLVRDHADNWVQSNVVRDLDGAPFGYGTILSPGTAKNALTVGSVQGIPGGYTGPQDVVLSDFSSMGPTDDGRVKPDLVAKGEDVTTTGHFNDFQYFSGIDGTSFAAPMVTGSLNLLLQLHEELNPDTSPMWGSTLKALAIHTTDEAGDPGPDYRHGWGLMNTQRAAEVLVYEWAAEGRQHIIEIILPEGETIEFPVVSNGNDLTVTICWTDPEGTPPAVSLNPSDLMLVNDLDLRVSDSDFMQTWEPWILDPANPSSPATTGDNIRDNVEQVVVSNTVEGEEYVVTVSHKGGLQGGNQPVSIIVTGNVPQALPRFEVTQFVQTGEQEFTMEWPSVLGRDYRFQSSEDLETWTDVPGDFHAIGIVTSAEVVSTPSGNRDFFRVVEVNE